MLVSFTKDARLTPRLRQDVKRRFHSHAAAFVGDVWQVDYQDVSGSLALAHPESIAQVTTERVDPYFDDHDKVFVLGVHSRGDRIVLAARELDVYFGRWGAPFQGSARESTQIARELIELCARMFSPLARVESSDEKRLTMVLKGGRLPTLNPDAIAAETRYKPSFQFVPNGTLLRPMRPVFNDDRTEIVGMTQMPWTFYAVEGRDGPLAFARIDSALSNALPPQPEEDDEPQLIVARTSGGQTVLRLVDNENRAPLPAIDVEVMEQLGGATIPLGTTDSDGRIAIPPNRFGGRLWVFVRHGRDTMARLPILPGAGDEPDLPLRPDAIRLDIEGRVMAMQTQIVDQVARRVILSGNLNTVTGVYEGGLIRKAIEKKEFAEAENLLKQLKESPSAESMREKLEATKEYARSLRPEDKWLGKIKRLFSETQSIIDLYFNADELADIMEDLEDELKTQKEEAAAAAGDSPGSSAAPATGASTTAAPDRSNS